MDRDVSTSLAGGGAGLTMITTIKWEAIPYGELVKLFVALGMIAFGYFMYRKNGGTPAS